LQHEWEVTLERRKPQRARGINRLEEGALKKETSPFGTHWSQEGEGRRSFLRLGEEATNVDRGGGGGEKKRKTHDSVRNNLGRIERAPSYSKKSSASAWEERGGVLKKVTTLDERRIENLRGCRNKPADLSNTGKGGNKNWRGLIIAFKEKRPWEWSFAPLQKKRTPVEKNRKRKKKKRRREKKSCQPRDCICSPEGAPPSSPETGFDF